MFKKIKLLNGTEVLVNPNLVTQVRGGASWDARGKRILCIHLCLMDGDILELPVQSLGEIETQLS